MSQRSYKICAVILLFFIFFALAAPALGATGKTSKKKVTIAFVKQEGLMERDKDGNLSGYTYDYIMKLAQYADWDVEFLYPKSKDQNEAILEMMDSVSSGKADIMTGMVYSEGMEKLYEYPKKSYGYAFTTLIANKNNTEISEDNLVLKDKLRIAVIENADTRNEELDAFCKLHNIQYAEVNCSSEEEQLEALKNGDADVMVSLSLLPYAGTKVVARFADRPFYFACGKGNKTLCDEIDQAIEAIDYTQPDFRKNLHDKYFSDKKGGLTFTKAGQAYLTEKKKLKILMTEEIKPLQSEGGDGKYQGVFVSFIDYLSEATGLETEIYPLPKGKTLQEAMDSGEYDMTMAVPSDYQWAGENGLTLSVPLVTSNRVLFYNRSVDVSDLSKLKCCDADKIEDRIKNVETGKADYGYGAALVVNYSISNNSYQEIATLPVSEETSDYSVSFGKGSSLELIAIVNEVIESIDAGKMNSFILQSSQIDNKDLLSSWIRRNPAGAIGAASFFVVLILCLIAAVINNRRKKRENLTLVRVSNAKSEFLSRMSHEMRTPLNAIVGVTALAEGDLDSPQAVKEHLAVINDSSDYLLRLINDILDMAKIESGELNLNPVSYHYKDFQRTISVMMTPLCKKKHINFISDYEMDEDTIFVDKVRFDQIFINLLTNAVKFTPEYGRVEFTVRAEKKEENYMDAVFVIKDNGVGMSEKFQKILFEPFTQEKSDGSASGTGLGLAISKNIVDMMGGSFHVESGKDIGTAVTIGLKLQLAPEEAMPEEGDADAAYKNLRGKRILLVEDNDMNRQIAMKILQKKEMEVYCAVNGKEAVSQFADSEPGFFDGVLMDIRMPEMDGLTATEKIREMDRNDAKKIPIIAMTADAFDKDVERAKLTGISGYLAKPVNISLLYETLEKMI